MNRLVFGVFSDSESANSAIDDLSRAGFSRDDVSVIVQDERVRGQIDQGGSTVENVAGGAASGAATGGVIGGLLGLLAGLTAFTVPGLGALLIGGPIASALGLTGAAATTVSGAVTGALAGGLVGALVGLGVPQEQAQMYEERVKSGNVLVIVSADDEAEAAAARSAIEGSGAHDINSYTVTR